jgi:pyruvate formate lyase activating enzyme
VLEECLSSVDYVAMDVKTCKEKYKLLGAQDTVGLMRTMEILKTGKVPYEFRTTVVPEIVTAQDATCIGELVKGSKNHALQQFIPQDTLDKRFQTLKPYTPETINDFAEIIHKYTENVLLRV